MKRLLALCAAALLAASSAPSFGESAVPAAENADGRVIIVPNKKKKPRKEPLPKRKLTDREFRQALARRLYGKIRVVSIGEDAKVRVVGIGEDLRVRVVSIGENSPGLWRYVDIGEDFKIRFVDIGEDITVRFVSIGEGPSN